MRLDDRILQILSESINEMNDAFSIAYIIEGEDHRKRGSMHLAVKMAGRRLEREGAIIILPPNKDAGWYSYTYCLTKGV